MTFHPLFSAFVHIFSRVYLYKVDAFRKMSTIYLLLRSLKAWREDWRSKIARKEVKCCSWKTFIYLHKRFAHTHWIFRDASSPCFAIWRLYANFFKYLYSINHDLPQQATRSLLTHQFTISLQFIFFEKNKTDPTPYVQTLTQMARDRAKKNVTPLLSYGRQICIYSCILWPVHLREEFAICHFVSARIYKKMQKRHEIHWELLSPFNCQTETFLQISTIIPWKFSYHWNFHGTP